MDITHSRRSVMMTGIYIFLILAGLRPVSVSGQPEPGDFYREYTWTTPFKEGHSRHFRVGGRLDYQLRPEYYPDLRLEGEKIYLGQEIETGGALKSEVTVEKILCHDGTKHLRIAVNGNDAHIFPESEHIPAPQELYMHHLYPTVEIPLQDFMPGMNNYFAMEVDTLHAWNWPQNLIYGLVFRFYHPKPAGLVDPVLKVEQADEATIRIGLQTGNVTSGAGGSSESGGSGGSGGSSESDGSGSPGREVIESVDFVARYEGPDMNGDGDYHDWHYHTYRGQIRNHLGTATEPPYGITWDIRWVPDQEGPVQIAALVRYASGHTYFIPAVDFLIRRESYSVELCKPENQPQRWLTRKGEHEQYFQVKSDPSNMTAAKMVFSTWSPGYFNGIYINDFLVFLREGPRYDFMQHDVPIEYLDALQQGRNTLRTGQTPKHHGAMVHGVEVLWPGIMVLVKNGRPGPSESTLPPDI